MFSGAGKGAGAGFGAIEGGGAIGLPGALFWGIPETGGMFGPGGILVSAGGIVAPEGCTGGLRVGGVASGGP